MCHVWFYISHVLLPIFFFFFANFLHSVAINFVTDSEIRMLHDIEQYYSTQIDEMPVNINEML
jgi:hypothetical protein